MPARVFSPLIEVFLLVEQPRQRLSHWTQALAPLDDLTAPPVATIDAYYEPTSNLAIFGLRYDELALGPDRLQRIIEVAVLAEITMIQPAELSEGDRRRFVGERLATCTEHVGDQRKVVSALVELVRRVRGQKSTSPIDALSAVLPRTSPVAARTRSAASSPPPAITARGTRDGDATDPVVPHATHDLARGSVRQPRIAALDAAVANARAIPEVEQKQVISEPITTAPRPLAGALPQRRAASPRLSPNVITRGGVHRANTVMMTPLETQRMLEAASVAPAIAEALDALSAHGERVVPVVPVPATPAGSESPYGEAPASAELEPPPEPGSIYARYLRSGRWVPIRIGALSLKGATLMSGALPRINDRVDISLLYGNHRALVRGTVARLSSKEEAAASGATTFTAGFELDDASRRQLTVLLTAARAARVTLKPPPPRSTQRFPVDWPVCLGTTRGAVRAEALDVSTAGMFVKPVHALTLDANVTFTAVLDDALSPVSGHARVVRSISDVDAKVAGLSPGYGINILEMPALDRERWCAFLTRIEQRTSKRVLIGASPVRLAELQGGLVAAGYTATGGSDPGAIAQLASAATHPIDAALIDAGWLAASGSPSWVEALFAARNVPCVTMHGDARRARIAIDRLLSVA
jgi:PilZ domain-containing protein